MYVIIVLGNNFSAVGFILAAKGFARFKQLEERQFAEYVLIGTLASTFITLLLAAEVKGAMPSGQTIEGGHTGLSRLLVHSELGRVAFVENEFTFTGERTHIHCEELRDRFNLETAVGREKDVQDIDAHGRFEKLVVTLLVMRAFSNFPGALRACAYFRDPTAVSRFNGRPIVHLVTKTPSGAATTTFLWYAQSREFQLYIDLAILKSDAWYRKIETGLMQPLSDAY